MANPDRSAFRQMSAQQCAALVRPRPDWGKPAANRGQTASKPAAGVPAKQALDASPVNRAQIGSQIAMTILAYPDLFFCHRATI
jgi:hypothetical protein